MFEKQMASLFSVDLSINGGRDDPLSTDVMAYCGRRLQFASLKFSPHITHAGNPSPASGRRWLATVQHAGEAVVTQGGRTGRIGPGDMFLLDLESPFHIETGNIVTHSIYIDSRTLRRVTPDASLITAVRIDTVDGPGAIFRAMADEVFRQAPRLSELAADRIADALPYALAVALTGCDVDPALPASRVQAFHRQRIYDCVAENLSDSELDGEAIAQAVGLSPRYVYRLFADEGTSLMRWVWSQRLERCHQDLVSPALVGRPIGEIAYGWGFSDVAHFSRTFKERFGMTPRDYRKTAAQTIVPPATLTSSVV
ncbi:helix-turn-helix domain-containing protein [Paraburkholderia sediminicola]|uniref:Helix-turn-helix domain-containing protein n=1 Tax=Paraburkholderia metrosideri TaxID=580937 RepID=A0ABW9DVW8_9BURK